MDQLYAGKFDVVSKILVSGSKIASGGGERKPHWYKTRTVATPAIGGEFVPNEVNVGLMSYEKQVILAKVHQLYTMEPQNVFVKVNLAHGAMNLVEFMGQRS